jgi:hypothetical protein
MKRLRALKDFEYATRALKAGDEFDCEPNHAHTLETVGHAEEVVQERPKRAYHRRDMKAEGSV